MKAFDNYRKERRKCRCRYCSLFHDTVSTRADNDNHQSRCQVTVILIWRLAYKGKSTRCAYSATWSVTQYVTQSSMPILPQSVTQHITQSATHSVKQSVTQLSHTCCTACQTNIVECVMWRHAHSVRSQMSYSLSRSCHRFFYAVCHADATSLCNMCHADVLQFVTHTSHSMSRRYHTVCHTEMGSLGAFTDVEKSV